MLVAVREGRVIGYTAYGMTGTHAYGTAHEVLPVAQGQGIGDQLHGARLQDAKERGATHFVGATTDPRMAKILEDWGGVKVDVKDEQGQDVYVNGLGR